MFLKMDSLNILGARLRDCIKSHLLQFGKGDIKGNIYILLGGNEFTLSISDLCEGKGEPPRKEKYLGGYYDKVKAMLPEGDSDKHYAAFVDFFSDVCMDTGIRESTRKNYFRTLDTLEKYAPVAAFCDIDKTFVCGYERFLCSMGMKANTIVKHMKHLKKALRQACLKGYSKHSIEELFSLCSVKPEKTFRESLTTKELVVLYQFLENNFDTMEEKEREILSGFLFSCLTGLRYSDICSVEYSNIKRIRNKRWLFLTMKKTSQKVFIPIEQMFSGKALGIMRLFHRTRGKLFHMPSNAICNRVIKRVYKKLFRSRKNISFHRGRHTAATLLLYHDTPLTTIKEILGHTNIRTTEIYADINEATIYNSIAKIKFKELEKVERRIARSFSNKS